LGEKLGEDGEHRMWAKAGHVNERGRPFHHKSVRAMLDE